MVDTVSDYYTDIRLKYNRLNPLSLEGTGMTDAEFYAFCMENPELREKMDEYMNCGCRLGWLVDPQNRCTYVYSANGDKQTVKFDEVLSGGEVMPGLEVRLGEVLGV